MPVAKKQDDYERLARRELITWLGEFPANTKELTGWRCSRGHKFRACYNNIDQGMRCKKCILEDNGQRQRHSPSAYHALAENRGLFWLGPAVASALAPTVWECRIGHRWSARYNSIQQGRGCAKCANERIVAGRRRQPAEYHQLASTHGFIWLGPIVASTKSRTNWECEAGHRWSSCYNWIQQGNGCRQCSGLSPRAPEHFHELARERGFTWLGPLAINTRTKTTWTCGLGHQWNATYSSVFGGSGCPECSGNINKTIEEFCRVAEDREFLWLGPVVCNSKTKTEWQCPKGHRWFAPFNAVQQGSGCWACSGLMPKSPDDYAALAELRCFTWEGPRVNNTSEKTGWRCADGHLFRSAYNTISAGHGCPDCLDMVNGARVSKNQRLLCDMIGGELNGERVGRFVIDVTKYVEETKIAVEYDTWFIHGPSNQNDLRKDQALLAAGWRVLRIRTNKKLPSPSQLEDALQRLVDGELWVDIEMDDWGFGRLAPWLDDNPESDAK
jgi:hypothetical protein